ncbi:MAG: hypothetical protein OHK0053_21160 [Microscillaceae bacterium]
MKNFCAFLVFSILFVAHPLKAQLEQYIDLLDRTWQVEFDRDEYIRTMPSAEWEEFNKLSYSEKRKHLDRLYQNAAASTFEFKSNFTFKVRMNGEVLEEGQWKVEPDGKTIVASNETGFHDIIHVVSISRERIVLNSEQYGRKVSLIPLQKDAQ